MSTATAFPDHFIPADTVEVKRTQLNEAVYEDDPSTRRGYTLVLARDDFDH